MLQKQVKTSFTTLFKKYRLRSEIESLSQFGDILAEEGIVYETSLFTRWQNGTRLPKNRYIILKIVSIFITRKGIQTISEVNAFLESAGQGYLTDRERDNIHALMIGASVVISK